MGNLFVDDNHADRAIARAPRRAKQKPALLVGAVARVFVAVFGLLLRYNCANGLLGGARIDTTGVLADLQVVRAHAMAGAGIAIGFRNTMPGRVDGQDRPGCVEHRNMRRQGIEHRQSILTDRPSARTLDGHMSLYSECAYARITAHPGAILDICRITLRTDLRRNTIDRS